MRLLGGLLFAVGVAPLLQLTRAQAPDGGIPSATRSVWTRFAEEDVSDVGVGEVHPIASDEEEIEQELVAALESDPQATVVVHIGLGELLCDSLEDASDSTLLRFNISSTETVIAERTSYSSIDGNIFPDGETRKTWMGEVVDPEPPAGSAPRTVSMTWTNPCGVESFLLTVVSHNNDGSTSIVRSIPCAAGSSSEVCMVELAVVFNDGDSAVDSISADNDDDDFESMTLENPGESVEGQEGRMLKTIRAPTKSVGKESLHSRGSPGSRELQAGNTQLPYDQMLDDTTDYGPELDAMTGNAAVAALRDEHEADLVLLVGYFPNTCGRGWIFNFNEALGFSLMDSICFSNWTQTHEIGHNLGCRHDRDNSNTGMTAYGHGLRYCTGIPQ
ncbi:PKD domain protein [Ectocarpus siliculosus]|uniref:PKD domain protein n=1 Tax=Ectocarpus siliculosus TaxID=2880 RepID=D8LLU0_ECTSI|nr:PKD domain protein [Ectocarpus siliculosus]|eukprot:CBN76176.1 PKD domain protein [Ectocarpus siliculosus]